MNRQKIEQILAYHEAGHAVMAYIVRSRFGYITIESNQDFLAHMSHQPLRDRLKITLPRLMKAEMVDRYSKEAINYREVHNRSIEKYVMVNFAGNCAEKIFTGENNLNGSVGDFNDVFLISREFLEGFSEKQRISYLEWLYNRTGDILSHPDCWNAVKAIAEELVKVKKIGYMRARQIIRTALSKG